MSIPEAQGHLKISTLLCSHHAQAYDSCHDALSNAGKPTEGSIPCQPVSLRGPHVKSFAAHPNSHAEGAVTLLLYRLIGEWLGGSVVARKQSQHVCSMHRQRATRAWSYRELLAFCSLSVENGLGHMGTNTGQC